MTRPPEDLGLVPLLDPRWAVFLRVVQAGSLTRAAADTDSTQPVVSRQLAALEADCGMRLFHRTGRGMALTEAGERVLPRVRAMLDEAGRLRDEVHSARGLVMGDVRVGLLPAVVPRVAEGLFRTVRTRFPEVRLHMTEGTSVQLAEMVATGRLDMALLLREGAEEEDPEEWTLRRMPLYLIGAADDPLMQQALLPFARLHGLGLILPAQPHPLRSHLEAAAREHGIALVVSVEANSIALQKEIAAAGGCYAIVAGTAIVEDVRARRLGSAKIVEPTLWRRVVLTTTPLRPDTPATREVKKLLRTLYAAGTKAASHD
jgi:DNA-binding transcriptional LysR family regulator